MFLFIILALIFALLSLFIILTVSALGAGAIIIFGDIFICLFILGWIIKKIFFKKKKDE